MSNIQWTDETWNPIVGCSRISAGCKNCYAAEAAKSARLQQFSQYKKVKDWDGATEFVESQLLKPLTWKKPKKIFVCSMGDLFHATVPFEWIDKIFAVMAIAPQHTFQVPTKRPNRMLEYFLDYRSDMAPRWVEIQGTKQAIDLGRLLPLPNVWLGVSVENQQAACDRIPLLLHVPAATRFLSCEPLLEQVVLTPYFAKGFASIDWVICGGESGTGARPCHLDWLRSIVKQCQATNTKVFVKQLGSNAVDFIDYRNKLTLCPYNYKMQLSDRKGGNIEEFPNDLKVREFPA